MRTIADQYELPDDDGDEYGSWHLRRPRRRPWRWVALLALVVLIGAGAYVTLRVSDEQQTDTFCLSCHLPSETTYFNRTETAMAGALAADLASFHYQQIRGQGNTLRCIDCHQGNGETGHRIDLLTLSARNAILWLTERNNPAIEKGYVSASHLANDGCLGCHEETLLLTGMENHHHNMLPAAYERWRNGGKLIAPESVKDKQAVITSGLKRYETRLLCADCHQTHRNIETDQYLDKKAVLPVKCAQCHRETGQGPLDLIVQ
jgi:hypothetical protein